MSKPSLLALLHRANQVATEHFDRELGDRKLTPRQIQVLATLAANEGASQTLIVDLTGIDRSTLADIVRRLMKQGLLRRRRSKKDARANVMHLTEAGQQMLAAGMPVLERVEKRLIAALSVEQRADFLNALEHLIAANTK
jgi:MarR family transcriptional regulator, temperature-dependent positive regulator of motility